MNTPKRLITKKKLNDLILNVKYILLYLCLLLALKQSNGQQGIANQISLGKNSNSAKQEIEQCWKLRQTDSKKAISCCYKSLHNLGSNQPNIECKLLNYIGVLYLNSANIDSAYIYFRKALNKSFTVNNHIETAYAYNNLGDYYIEISNYLLATENILKSYKIFKEQNYEEGVAYNLLNLSEIYTKQNKYETALDTLAAALKIRESINDLKKIALTKRRIVLIYLLQNELEAAENLLEEIFNTKLIEENPNARANYLDLLSRIFYEKKEYDGAKELRIEANKLNKKLGNKKEETIGLSKQGEIYFALDSFLQAEKIIIQSQQIAKSIGQKETELNNYLMLSKIYKAQNKYEDAYQYLNIYNRINDSINSKLSRHSISNYERAYSEEKAENEKKLLEEKLRFENNVKQYLKLFSFLIAFFFIYLLYANFAKRRTNRQLKASNDAKDRFFSILSHDIKGPITNIKLISELLNMENATDKRQKNLTNNLELTVDNLIKLVNRLIQWSKATSGNTQYNPTNFTIKAEIENVLLFAKDYALTKKQHLTFNVKKDYSVNADKEMVNTILRNLVANAIKFTPKNGSIKLRSFKKSNTLIILVEDTGVGMTKEMIDKIIYKNEICTTIGTNNEKGTGIGLSLCKELVKINKGKFWIKSKPNRGSKFYFSLPLSN